MSEKRSTLELSTLKSQWRSDPIWDLELTEGFEAHFEELRAYREFWETQWVTDRVNRLQKAADDWNCAPKTAEYLLHLEEKVTELEGTVLSILDRLSNLESNHEK